MTEIAKLRLGFLPPLRAGALGDLDDEYDDTVEDIGGLPYLPDSEKNGFVSKAGEVLEKAKSDIDAADTPKAVDTVKENTKSAFNDVLKDAEDKDGESEKSQKANADTHVKDKAEEIRKKINAAEFLTTEQKDMLNNRVDDALSDFNINLEGVRSTGTLNWAIEQANFDLDEVATDCMNWNLSGAKLICSAQIDERRDTVNSEIEGFIYLNENEKNEWINKTNAIFDDGEKKINDSTTVKQVLAERDATLRALDSHAENARVAQKEACVNKLKPFIIVFAIFFVLEAIAFAVLWVIYKKRMNEYYTFAFAPVTVVGAMLGLAPTGAWVLAISLGVVDVLLAVAIIYLAVRLYSTRPRGEDVHTVAESRSNMPANTKTDKPVLRRNKLFAVWNCDEVSYGIRRKTAWNQVDGNTR